MKRGGSRSVARGRAWPVGLLAVCSSSACRGPQSTLDTGGPEAERIASLFWWMAGGSLVIWGSLMALALYATWAAPKPDAEGTGRSLIVVGGVVVPTVLLAALLVYGLWMLPKFLAPAPHGSLRVQVSGEQWWWRVRYVPPQGAPVELANEIRLPVGEPVEFELESPDVIHSFWIPSLGGKVDMIPGRKTRLRLAPDRVGTYRGACAEYCGTAHAWMAFPVVVLPRPEFDAWLAAQSKPARPPQAPAERSGAELVLENGCGACHTIRGTPADGVVGPDLTHVGGRGSLGAGTLSNDHAAFDEWLARTDAVKPGVHMPSFGMLAPEQRSAMAAYLESLE